MTVLRSWVLHFWVFFFVSCRGYELGVGVLEVGRCVFWERIGCCSSGVKIVYGVDRGDPVAAMCSA